MSINVKTENVKDATVQVHIAFENAGYGYLKNRRSRSVRIPNHAALRSSRKQRLVTGKNSAEHKYRRKSLNAQRFLSAPEKVSPA
ncbi:MAG: hypothetical protein R3C51_11300 [Parvularculaceae bacterium]